MRRVRRKRPPPHCALASPLAPSNIPGELSSFIGRAAELQQLVKIQPTTRLLTLVGPGGVGKTRLALRLALALRDSYASGVWFVDVAALSDSAMLTQTVATALGVRDRAGQSIDSALVDSLAGCDGLIILDNCEHLIDECSRLVASLLRACPGLDVVATSREPLDTEGDLIWRVPPLALPALNANTPADFEASEAVQLFVARARAHDPRFTLTARNCVQVAEICAQLDGLPLALELVAARVRGVAERDLARLGVGLALQVTGQRSAPRRQQTLRATLAWSYELLTELERIVFRRLAVFANGFQLAAAEAICADDLLPVGVVVHAVERLVARSLVMADRQPGGVSYSLMQTVRGFALELMRAADEADLIQRRHLDYMLSIAERARPDELDAEHARVLDGERENLRSAMAFALAADEVERGLRLATAAISMWFFRGRYGEGRDWLERFLHQPATGPSLVRARAQAWLGHLLQMQGEYHAAEAWIRQALEQQEALEDVLGAALSVGMLGQLALMRGDLPNARVLCAEAARRLGALGNPSEVSAALQSAVVAVELGEVAEAHRLLTECEPRGRTVASLAAWLLFLRGRVADASGDVALAESLMSEALLLHRSLADSNGTMVSLIELGHFQLDRQRTAHVAATFAEAVDLAHRAGDRVMLARALEGIARCAAAKHTAAAVRLAGAADGLRSAIGGTAWPSERRRLATWLPRARRMLTASVYHTSWQAGRVASIDQAVQLARNLSRRPDTASVARRDPLTRREREVVVLLARAYSNQQIAAELTISPGTARTHVDHVFAKLGLHSRAQVAVWAAQPASRRMIQSSSGSAAS